MQMLTPRAPDPQLFRQVLGRYATGVVLVTAQTDDDRPGCGIVANSFTSVSLDPPLVSFCAGKSSSTWPLIRAAGSFAVNILGDHHRDACRAFVAKEPGRDELLAGATRGAVGAPLLPDALGWIECEIAEIYDAGDHELVLGEVLRLELRDERAPLLFYEGKLAQVLTRREAPDS